MFTLSTTPQGKEDSENWKINEAQYSRQWLIKQDAGVRHWGWKIEQESDGELLVGVGDK